MSITVSQDLQRSAGAQQVLAGRSARAVDDSTAQARSQKSIKELPQGEGIKAPASVIAMLDARQSERTQYDSPNQKAQKAISAYQDVLSQPQRDRVQTMFSVDLYA